jgi:hypothetical protein
MVMGAVCASACEEKACTEEAIAGATITVEDPDGNRVCDAVVQVIGEGVQEELEASSPDGDCVYFGLYEKDGVFDVDVFKDGFRRVLLGDVLRIGMDEDGCHVVPEKLTVTLEAE